MHEEVNSMLSGTWMRRGITAVVFLLAVFLLVETISGLREYSYIGGGVPATNTITVSGEGEVFAIPDTATFSFTIMEEATTVEAAQERATQKENQVLSFLEGEGVEEQDIKTVNYSVSPRYEYRRSGVEPAIYPPVPDGTRTLVGFEVHETIEVKVVDTEAAGGLLSGIGEIGVSSISGLQFTIDDEDALRAEARASAIDDARAKAEQLADDLNVRLVRVVSFSEGYGYAPFAVSESAARGSADDAVLTPQIPTGENRIGSNVSITYEIR
jgi:hypothetical protein